MSALKLEYDNVIVGGGLAGLIASMRLHGSTVLLSGGLGATAVSSGVFTLTGNDPEAGSWFEGLMGDTGCRYVRGTCITSSKVTRSGLVQASTLYEGSPVFIAFNEERRGFDNIKFMRGHSLQEIARILDTNDTACAELVEILSKVKAESILLPPVLGMDRPEEVKKMLGDKLGMKVGEYVTAPSVLGLRMLRALEKKASANPDIEILDIVKVNRIEDGRIDGHMGTKGKRELSVRAQNLFIATGGLFTGFKMSGDRLFEPLAGVMVSPDIGNDLRQKFISGHPLMYKGIGPRHLIKGFRNVRAIGATACGFGLYQALESGFHAGDGI
jgi:glycerol-3-phosphate dehydrogenase subunit B